MRFKELNVIGLMTGTSMDGIDISLVKTNGISLKRLNHNYFYRYNLETRELLSEVLNDNVINNLKNKKKLDKIVTEEHYNAVKNLKLVEKSDLIGFHGQTIYHNPDDKISIQLGNPHQLANMLNKNVIFGFRNEDIEFGGQGAPLAPIYHKFIMKKFDIALPACILNIGGVANMTFWNGTKLIGFDTGPGNALMDDYMKLLFNKYFDKDGILASKGVPINGIVHKFMDHNYFKEKPPKSLDRNSFIDLYKKLLNERYATQDVMATLAEFTIVSIIKSLSYLPEMPKNLFITGGGYRNKHLMKNLRERLDLNIINESDVGINFDYIEAELIAFLSARSIYNLPTTFPDTTGVSKPISGGTLFTNL